MCWWIRCQKSFIIKDPHQIYLRLTFNKACTGKSLFPVEISDKNNFQPGESKLVNVLVTMQTYCSYAYFVPIVTMRNLQPQFLLFFVKNETNQSNVLDVNTSIREIELICQAYKTNRKREQSWRESTLDLQQGNRKTFSWFIIRKLDFVRLWLPFKILFWLRQRKRSRSSFSKTHWSTRSYSTSP